MAQKLDKIFDSFVENNLFKDKRVLQTNYTPDTIPHRDNQIENVASILAPALRGDRVSNLFIYGKTGTGKTLSVQHVTNELMKRVSDSKSDNLKVVYINCKLKKIADTDGDDMLAVTSQAFARYSNNQANPINLIKELYKL